MFYILGLNLNFKKFKTRYKPYTKQDELEEYMANLENKQPVLPNVPSTSLPSK